MSWKVIKSPYNTIGLFNLTKIPVNITSRFFKTEKFRTSSHLFKKSSNKEIKSLSDLKIKKNTNLLQPQIDNKKNQILQQFWSKFKWIIFKTTKNNEPNSYLDVI